MEAEEEDQNQLELLCRLIPLRQTYTLWFLLASHVFFAITAILGNSLIIATVYRVSSLHPPSKTLLRSLALTDLFVGLLVDSIFIVFLITLDSKGSEICASFFKISYSTSQILSSVSLSVLTAYKCGQVICLNTWFALQTNPSTAIEYSPRTINKPGRATKYGEVQKDDSIDLSVDIANTCCVLSSPHGGFCVNCF